MEQGIHQFRLFLATANCGSVFENIEEGLDRWLDTFLNAVQDDSPDFVAIHFQETGGKNYQNCTKEIYVFFNELKRRFEELKFFQVEGFVDSQSELEDQFTALASVYFVCGDVNKSNVQIWNFKDEVFSPVSTDNPMHIGEELTKTDRKQKEKFPQDFFPDFKWSRKGFLRTRWKMKGVPVDLVNCHLFHDSCNLIAGSSFPSPFAQNRLKTLNYTLDKLLTDDEPIIFFFGDFNFRLNTYEIFEILRRQKISHKDADPKNSSDETKTIDSDRLVIDSKFFSCPDQEERFKNDFNWLSPFEFEAKQFTRVNEFPLNFHPSYPFDEILPDKFMRTRCPAWCDRVLFTHSAKSVISNASESQAAVYQLIGSNVCMGDHKPVYLSFNLRHEEESLQSDDPTKSQDLQIEAITGDNLEEGKNCCPDEEENDKENSKSIDSIKSNKRKCKCLVSFFRKSLISKGRRRHGHKNDPENNSVLLPHNTDCDFSSPTTTTDKLEDSNLGNNSSQLQADPSRHQEIRDLNSNSCASFLKKCSTWKSKESSSCSPVKCDPNSQIVSPTLDDKSNSIKLGKTTGIDSNDLLLSPIIIDSNITKLKSLEDEQPESLALSFDRLSLNHSGSIVQVQEEEQNQPLNPNNNDDVNDGKSGKKLAKRKKLFRLSKKKERSKIGNGNNGKKSKLNQENESTSNVLCNKCIIL